VTLVASAGLLFSGSLATPGIAATDLCTTPPDVVPVADLSPGDMATGWTVVEGTDPVSFDVEIVGVLPDGIAPGVDFILVHVSGPVIDETGGIAFGFSGSPVYLGGDLVGSVSYGFFGADQTYGGVTPAESMVKLFDYPDGTVALGATAVRQQTFAQKVRLPDGLRRRAALQVSASLDDVPTTAEPLRVPVAVSGLHGRHFKKFTKTLRLSGMDVTPYRAGAASVGPLALDPIEPGDAVAGALSVGDLTVAGVGTATAVCDDLVLAFGHPFFWEGAAGEFPMAMYGASVVAVVPDPSQVFGAFKIANLTDLHGIVDQDRLTGIRGHEGVDPTMVPVTSVVSNPDIATIRSGETDIFKQEFFGFPFVPDAAAFHLLVNEDVVHDRIGDGSVTLEWVVEGTGPDGPFRLVRPNVFYSPYDASYESIFELYSFLFQIQDNEFGAVDFDSIDMDAEITQQQLTAEIVRVESASSLQPSFRERDRLRVRPGDTIQLRVFLLPEGALDEEMVELTVAVPHRGRGGNLSIQGGAASSCLYCYYFDEGDDDGGPVTFTALIRQLRQTPRNNDLVATLRAGGEKHETTFRADDVILGEAQLDVSIVR
jgi:hypothetical protein